MGVSSLRPHTALPAQAHAARTAAASAVAAASPASALQRLLTRVFRTVGVAMVPLAMQVPSALTLYWAASGSLGLVQTLALRYPAVRRVLRIPPTPSESRKPVRDLLKSMVTRTAAFWRDVAEKHRRA